MQAQDHASIVRQRRGGLRRDKARSYSEDVVTSKREPAFMIPTVMAVDGRRIPLTSLWSHRKIALVFLRHLGCRFCWYQASELRKITDQLTAHEVPLVIIALGTPAQARQFQDEVKLSAEIYVDDPPFSMPADDTVTDLTSNAALPFAQRQDSYAYFSFKLRRGKDVVFTSNLMSEAEKLGAMGFTDHPHLGGSEKPYPSDVLQLGGAFVVGPGNQCDYAWRSSWIGDFINTDLLVTAATGVKPSGLPYVFPSTSSWLNALRADSVANATTVHASPLQWRKTAFDAMLDSASSVITKPPLTAVDKVLATHTPPLELPSTAASTSATPAVGAGTEAACPFLQSAKGPVDLSLSPHAVKIVDSAASISTTSDVGAQPTTHGRRSWVCPLQSVSSRAVLLIISVTLAVMFSALLWWPVLSTEYPYELLTRWIPVSVSSPVRQAVMMLSPRMRLVTILLVLFAMSASCSSWILRRKPSSSKRLPNGEPVKSRSTGPSIAAEPLIDQPPSAALIVPPLELFTPSDIDNIIMQIGLEDCDCAAVLGSIPMNLSLQRQNKKTTAAVTSSAAASTAAAAVEGDLSPTSTDDESDTSSTKSHSILEDRTVLAQFQTTLCYVREFLAKPHPLVGRKGPTCPFVPKSLQLNSIYLGMVRTPAHCPPANIEAVVVAASAQFTKLQPVAGRMAVYKAIILIFPDVPLEEAELLIDGVQRKLKAHFVQQGLMLGEFHLQNNSRGLHNPDFFPLRTPYPCLAIRNMVPSDIAFMTGDQYDPATQVTFLESFIRKLSHEPTTGVSASSANSAAAAAESKELAFARTALDKARSALSASSS